MEGLLRVDTSSTFPGSPTNSFLADEVASTCPLLTPSPPTNALVNPLPVTEESNFLSAEELVTKLHHVQDDTEKEGDSASHSSTSSEPVCAQLLSGHNLYLHITKNEETASQETGGKTQNLQMTFRNPPENYCFTKWNWPLIRKVSTWLFLSGLMAMVAVVVAMMWTLPKTCNPPTQWYQGQLMYEIFPASYSDSNGDGIGDLKGVTSRIDYLESLGVRAIRLNSIFPAHNYPEGYKNMTSITDIAPQLGNLTDFAGLVSGLRLKNMHLTLDLPVWPFARTTKTRSINVEYYNENDTDVTPLYEFVREMNYEEDYIAKALMFWTKLGVDGFYLKGLEDYMENPNFASALRRWKMILGPDKMLLVHNNVIEATPSDDLNIVLNNVDLVDIYLEVENGVNKLSNQIETILNGTLFSKAGNPWIHWTLSNENTKRLANRLPFSNATLGASLLQQMLPGTPCIFYGDEIGLKQASDPHDDRKHLEHLHQLAPMTWDYPNKPFTRKELFPWLHSQPVSINRAQFKILSKMSALRAKSPSIYINSISKDGTNKANADIKYKENDLLVMQRWYPRRKSYVIVSNLGCVHISADLSTLLYSGEVIVGPTETSQSESISFKNISLWPGESVIVLLH